ncbi:MAG TPA: hypothetical protein VGI91_04680 [Steroidobacteraceae bacterium]
MSSRAAAAGGRARVCLALAVLVAACASTPDTPQARAEYLAELAQAYDIEGMVSRSQTEALAEARRRIEAVRSQFADELARATPAQRNRLEAAMDRFVTASRTPPDLNAAANVWAQGFAENLTTEDLRQIVAFAHTPAGRAQISASRDGQAYLEDYLRQLRSTGVDQAVQQYMTELRAVVTGGR